MTSPTWYRGPAEIGISRAREARKYAAAAREQCETLELVLRRPRKHPSRAVVDALAQCRSIAEGASVCHSPPLVDALAALEAALEKSLAKLPEERDADRGDGDGENDGVEAGVLRRARAPNETDVDWRRARGTPHARALHRRVRQYEWASEALSRVDTFSPETVFYAVRRRSAGDEGDDGHGDGSAGEDVSAEYAAGEAKLRDLASGMTAAYFLAVDAACAAESTFGAVACGLTSAAGASTSSLEHDEDDGDDDESSEREDVDALFARLDSARTALGTMEARARGVARARVRTRARLGARRSGHDRARDVRHRRGIERETSGRGVFLRRRTSSDDHHARLAQTRSGRFREGSSRGGAERDAGRVENRRLGRGGATRTPIGGKDETRGI